MPSMMKAWPSTPNWSISLVTNSVLDSGIVHLQVGRQEGLEYSLTRALGLDREAIDDEVCPRNPDAEIEAEAVDISDQSQFNS